MTFNVPKAIATAFYYDSNNLKLDNKLQKLFTDSNDKYYCKACGQMHNKGLIDKKNTVFGDKYNGFYSFEDANSPFLCEYCFFNFKNYKKSMLVKNQNEAHFKLLESLNEDEIKKSIEYIKELYRDLPKESLSKPQLKKIDLIENISSSLEGLKLAITNCFDYNLLFKLTHAQGFEEIANIYKKSIDMGDCIVYFDDEENTYKFNPIDFTRGSTNNGLYDIIKNPPEPPFVLMHKETKGSTFTESMHIAVETIDKSVIVLNYGVNVYEIQRNKVFDCLDEAAAIYKKYKSSKFNISDDLLFNSVLSSGYHSTFHEKFRNSEEFMNDFSGFINKYDYAIRFASKIILKTYNKKGR